MDCNKEEAIRAKEIAEKKMQVKDFVGAKKVALKAQQLFSDLDNISQMLTVCEVHCCAGKKVNGEMDWYGILQVEQTADESSLKKQYRKLALLLHPDKNKFPGAEAAFKLIGEANMTLSDRAKRSVYDIRRRGNIAAVLPRQPSYQANMTSFARKQPGVGNNFTSTATFHYGNINQQQPGHNTTFWTMCPKCCMKFRYYSTLLNKSIRCHNCLTYYTASEFVEQAVPRPSDSSANLRNHTGFGSGINMTHGNGGFKSKQNEVQPEKVNIGKMDQKEHPVKPSAANARRRRARKVVVESSDSDSYTSTDNEDVDLEDGVRPEEQNAGPSSGRHPQRSCRMKQNVTYKEARIEEEDFPSPRKRARKAAAHHANDCLRKDTSEERVPNGGESVNTHNAHESEQAPNVRSFSSPDSEFYDFEQERAPSKFAVDQIWAVYDELDAMPRYYVRIRQVHDPFRLHFTWLEHNPLSESEEVWTHEDLPVACGNYRLGNSETTTDLQMFSHPIHFNRGTKRNTYDIYPRKGEVWALFKGWDANWTSDANNHRLYEYEVVKVISDISDGSDSDFQVVHLLRVQGFVSLFVPSTVNRKSQILLSEVLRFSHRVPSYKIPNCESDGVEEGFYELDTASLPNNFGETFPSVNVDTTAVSAQKLNFNKEDSYHRTPTNKENFTSSSNDDYLPTEFHDFQKDRSIKKFKRGQIWALYSDIDQYPKFYAKIKKVDVDDIVVSASWVELHANGEDEAGWVEKELPATCGRFKVDRGTMTFESIDSFSHIVHANPIGPRADKYDIFPRSGEVWAIYKDWSADWTLADLGKCKYHVAEILEVGNSIVKAILLTKVADYIAVFKRETKGDVGKMLEIPLNENLRFSHQIPAFRLTNELDGALKGCWELDSASVPDQIFN